MNDGGDAIDSIASLPTHSLTACTARLVPESQIWSGILLRGPCGKYGS